MCSGIISYSWWTVYLENSGAKKGKGQSEVLKTSDHSV